LEKKIMAKQKPHSPEEIVAKLRQVDVLTGQGKTMAEAIRAIAVTEPTCYRWKSEYGGLRLDQVRRLRGPGNSLLPHGPILIDPMDEFCE
jgi:hypothetical protein